MGRWEGDTLVVDAAGFNDRTRLDVTITIDDPVMYTKPFTVKVTELLLPDSDVLETVCNENEKDAAHIK